MPQVSLALLIVLGLAISTTIAADAPATRPTTRPVPKLTVDEFEKRRGDKDAVVVDVRTPEEFAAGHIPGAINIPVQRSDFDQKVSALDKSKEYLVHCARGGRSATAASKMDKMGFKNLADFTGGMEAWKKANKPIDK